LAIDYESLLNFKIPQVEQVYSERDCILYALGIGVGLDPDERQLGFVYEKDLKAMPTMPVVLTYPGPWISNPETGVTYEKVVHGEHMLRLHQTLPPSGRMIGQVRIVDVIDKGEGRGALIVSEMEQRDADTGNRIATIRHTSFARADGGFGGPQRPSPVSHPMPDRPPDMICDLPTSPQSALLYRLNADPNPLHVDPDAARRAGFPKPILHGLGTFGVVGHGLLRSVCDYDPDLFGAISARFTAPTYPGDTIRTEIWREGTFYSFQARAIERDIIVIGNGRFEAR
jgi:acyl dehydratase